MGKREMYEEYTPSAKFMQTYQSGPISGKVLPPMSIHATTSPTTTATITTATTTATVTTATTVATVTAATTTATVTAANAALPRHNRRASMPMQYMDVTMGDPMYGGYAYDSYSGSYMNMNMGGYDPYNPYEQPMTNPIQLQMPSSFTRAGTSATSRVPSANNMLPRHSRRSSMPTQYLDASASGSMYGGYNAYNPYNMSGYSPYSSYGQSMTNQYKNPVILAAAENARPAFESIQTVVQSFVAVGKMLESTMTAMHISFQALLGLAENFSRLKVFMVKLCSAIVSFKLARWFLTKLIYLIRMVKGGRGTNFEEDLWSSLSLTDQEKVIQSDGRSWPLFVFTGILAATPYFVHKLLNTVPMPNSVPSTNDTNASVSDSELVMKSQYNWNTRRPETIPLVKGQNYRTRGSYMQESFQNGGWLYVKNSKGRKGYVPLYMLQHPKMDHVHPLVQPIYSEIYPNVINEVEIPTDPEQIGSEVTSTPIIDPNGNPISSPLSPIDPDDPLENNIQ